MADATSTSTGFATGTDTGTKRTRDDADGTTAPAIAVEPSKRRHAGRESTASQPRDDKQRQRLTAERLCNYCVDKDTNLMRSHIEEQFFVICDNTLPDCPIKYASDGFMALTGYNRREVLGRNCRFLQGPNTDPSSVVKIRKAVANSEGITVQLLNYKKNGEEFWNLLQLTPVKNCDGKTTAYVGCQQEISSPTRADDGGTRTLDAIGSILDCEIDQKKLLTSLPTSSLTYVIANPNIVDCPMTHVSDTFIKMTGYSRDECIGRNCRFLQGIDTDPETIQRLGEAARSGSPITVKILNYRKNGEPFWNMLHLSPVTDDEGNVLRIIGAQQDISADYVETMHETQLEIDMLSKSIMELVESDDDTAGEDDFNLDDFAP